MVCPDLHFRPTKSKKEVKKEKEKTWGSVVQFPGEISPIFNKEIGNFLEFSFLV
jgi:hypothetical protein